jgi:hypothetical protein
MEKSILEVFGEKSQDADELVHHTLQSIANMKRDASWEDILYKIQTKGGEDRYIHRGVSGFPTTERREWDANMLRAEIQQDPTFADTLSYKEGQKMVAPEEGALNKLLKLIGVYKNGGKVQLPSLEEFENIFSNVYKKSLEAGSESTEHSFNIMKELYDPEYYKNLKEEWKDDESILSKIIADSEDRAISYVNELQSRLDQMESRTQPKITFIPKEKEKQKGLMALLQRFIPGGKTGYKE